MTKTDHVVTRFAPSPTGFLHIGGARTALFNWMFARANAGRFLLRIEDTDRARSTPEAVQAILEGLTWLGVDWDGEPVSQSQRADAHVAAAKRLLADGRAYRDYATEEETEAGKQIARESGQAYRSTWRDKDPARTDAGTPFVVRFKGPKEGETVVPDLVQGDVRVPNKDLDDLIILRADGTPTYNLAVVVDDHDMGVTHAIRGDDHLVNAARQTLIYQAMGVAPPRFAHISLIHGADGKKLSKRHGALGVEGYRDIGALPEGLRNYLLRLGWAHGDMETFTDAEAEAVFTIEGMGKAPARLDLDKLASVNAWHMKRAAPGRLLDMVAPALAERYGEAALEAGRREKNIAAIRAVIDRAKMTNDLVDALEFVFLARPIALNKKARKATSGEAAARLSATREALASLTSWSEESVHAALEGLATTFDVGFGQIGAPLRAALTGGSPSPDIAVTAVVLGAEETLGRIDDCIGADSDQSEASQPGASTAPSS